MPDQDEIDYIDVKEACQLIGGKNSPVNPSTYYRGVRRGIYPPTEHPSPGIARVNRPAIVAALRKQRESAA
jgi:hypothetical protein